ncbi:MAG TPA: transcriptional activator RfaH [Rhodospirillales bacterium]|jgi:transcriptional antiterminator RfaH|nr:transcriptional activator RfaH [Rhodospirillales bacterium]
MKRWYVVQTRFRCENLARANLRRQRYEVFLPQYLKRRRHARRTEWVKAPLFPRYLFVRLDIETARWLPVRSTIGVHSMVCNGEIPAPVPENIVEDIRSREDEDGLVILGAGQTFSKGQPVQVLSGAFCDRVGLYDCVTDDERVIILLDLLGRQTKVRIPAEAICAYA